MANPGVVKLQGVVQHYDWGGYNFIPDLLEVENATHQPYAELWIGAHAKAPSLAEVAGEHEPLNDWIADAPEAILGEAASAPLRRPAAVPIQNSRCSQDAVYPGAPYACPGP